jgi:hypothetical protein
MDTPEIWAHHASEEIQPQWRSSTQESAGTMVGVLPNLIDGLPERHLLASGLGNFEWRRQLFVKFRSSSVFSRTYLRFAVHRTMSGKPHGRKGANSSVPLISC